MPSVSRIALGLLLLASNAFSKPVESAKAADDEYDYIVVGSGPGGGTIASNLARANYTVLLLEAGDQSVGQGQGMQYPPQLAWDFFVKHYADEKRNDKYSHLTWRLTDGSYWVGRDNPPAGAKLLGVYYPRGATVGGSSMVNAMVTFLPTESDWTNIVNITGDNSWSPDNMRKIFQKIEHNNYLPKDTPGHGFDGWFQTTMSKAGTLTGPILNIMQAEATSLGKDPSKITDMLSSDPNALVADRDKNPGIYGLPSHTRSNGQRFSSRDYILDTIAQKFPLTLSMTSLATKVTFSPNKCGGKPRATGVEYIVGKSVYRADSRYTAANNGTKKTATARKEVILSGGAFNSPQLLLLSGIGDATQLKQFNIPVQVDLPGVGRNLMDNQEMPVVGSISGAGFGSTGSVMLKTKFAPYGERDVFIMQFPMVFRGFWPQTQSNRALPQDPAGAYGISMVKQHPQNHAGWVKLASADPQDPPEINFNHFAEGKDVDMGAMKEVVKWARGVYNSSKVKAVEPPCPQGPDADGSCGQADEDWIYQQTFGHHPTSTNKIGSDDDKMAVLDGKFRVRGVAGLRVVDASAFPRTPGVFPVVSTFMIGQKASEVVIEDAKTPLQCSA